MGDCNNKTNTSNENPNVELFMTILVNIGNVLSILYNVPQMWRTHKLKKADDISSHFLWMRLSAGIIWSVSTSLRLSGTPRPESTRTAFMTNLPAQQNGPRLQ